MSGVERLVSFEVLGQKYQFYTAAGEKEMDEILALVREQVEGNSGGRRGTLPSGKVAMMACLNIASKYVQLKREFDNYKSDNEARAAQLSEEIRSSLLTGGSGQV